VTSNFRSSRDYESEVLGLTTEEAPSGQHTLTEDLCPAALQQFEGGGACSGGGPASAASVRAEGPRPSSGGERARQEQPLGELDSGRRVSRPAKSHWSEFAPVHANVPTARASFTVTPSPKATAASASAIPPSPNATGNRSRPNGDAGEPTPIDTSCRLLSCRVDALVLAYQLQPAPAFLDELDRAGAIAVIAGVAEIKIGNIALALRHNRRRPLFAFENADLRAVFDPIASHGWVLEVVLRAVFLATHTLRIAMALAEQMARGIGTVRARRLRRFDLCGDYCNFALAPGDIELFVTTRARRETFLVQAKDLDEVGGELCKPALREHRRSALEVTGISVASGNPLMARVYDKPAELALPGREEKRAIEHAIWLAANWDGQAPVARVEFQHRGAFLDEIGLRQPSLLEGALDAVWQRDVDWLRLVTKGTATRASRAALDPRWIPVKATSFVHAADPIPRNRHHRGGAAPAHVLGAAVSRLAASGELRKLNVETTAQGKLLDSDSFRTMTDRDAAAWVAWMTVRLFGAAGADSSRGLLQHGDPRVAALRLFAKLQAAKARFSSVDDDEAAQ